ncbi:drug metabolite transporter superfamily permease [Lacticaseibacillus thailandensis DSM 22698 = JCM 13996]|uniref:Drug metabolite transporter superfamily permease n=2 Tax=Lacticaseibacillus thailandensis TaxID=381741 RepID=A0A0R2C7S6_9LACO|nr:drug metabolite transporter superfamily permease [Lacticaseibacillus thailandensis DSM 22698 = JCM 13996]
MFLAGGAACLWGVSGPCSQYLFLHHVDLLWLIGSKMLFGGLVLGLYCLVRDRHALMAVWHSRKAVVHLLLFTIFGMVTMQLIYFQTVAVSNAATATIMQYLAPILILAWVAVSTRTWPRRADFVTIGLAMLGTLLVVTKGQITQLAISPRALWWGLLAAVAAAGYTLIPRWLLAHYSGIAVSAWSMLLGGLGLTAYRPFWTDAPQLTHWMWVAYAFVLVFGTIFAYAMYLISLRYIAPTVVGLLDAFEPLGAVVAGVLFMHLQLDFWEVVGGLIILVTVGLMSVLTPQTPAPHE